MKQSFLYVSFAALLLAPSLEISGAPNAKQVLKGKGIMVAYSADFKDPAGAQPFSELAKHIATPDTLNVHGKKTRFAVLKAAEGGTRMAQMKNPSDLMAALRAQKIKHVLVYQVLTDEDVKKQARTLKNVIADCDDDNRPDGIVIMPNDYFYALSDAKDTASLYISSLGSDIVGKMVIAYSPNVHITPQRREVHDAFTTHPDVQGLMPRLLHRRVGNEHSVDELVTWATEWITDKPFKGSFDAIAPIVEWAKAADPRLTETVTAMRQKPHDFDGVCLSRLEEMLDKDKQPFTEAPTDEITEKTSKWPLLPQGLSFDKVASLQLMTIRADEAPDCDSGTTGPRKGQTPPRTKMPVTNIDIGPPMRPVRPIRTP